MERSADSPTDCDAGAPPSSARSSDATLRPQARARDPLLALLGDESELVRRAVREELERRGGAGLALLERAARDDDPRIRSAARALILRRDRALVARRMVRLALQPRIALESGLWLMSRFETPALDVRPFQLALDACAAEVLQRLERGKHQARPSDVLIDYLAGELRFDGARDDYHHPQSVYLHTAITRRRGMPLTLAALYMAVARRAAIRATAVALPGHVMLRIYDGDRAVLCDPFNGGKRLSERDCLGYLADHGLPFQPHWFDDASEAALWLRHLRNLERSCRKLTLLEDARALRGVIGVLERRLAGGARS